MKQSHLIIFTLILLFYLSNSKIILANHSGSSHDHTEKTLLVDTELDEEVTAAELAQMQSIAADVLNDLKKAKGILATEAPNLIVKKFVGSQKIAVMKMDEGEIHLDVLTYKICRKMGADSLNGLAFILGHELGHFIHGHSEINHNIIDEINDEISSTQMRKVVTSNTTEESEPGLREGLSNAIRAYRDTYDEAEADFEGGFLGYLAGYEPMNAGKDFLKRVYSNRLMNLNETTAGYPSLNERINIVENTGEELNTLTPLFEMSNYLMAIEQYEDAIPYLEKVLEKFQSREVYNNIGVIYLLETLRIFKKPVSDYSFPLTLDASFRAPVDFKIFSSGTMSDIFPRDIYFTEKCNLSVVQEQIEIAEGYFQKAILLDNEYATGLLNLSIAQTIKAILYAKYPCKENKVYEFNKALGSASSAKEIAEQAMSTLTLEYFDELESDSVSWVSLQSFQKLLSLPTQSEVSIETIDGVEVQVVKNYKSIYPKRTEVFNDGNYSIEGYSSDKVKGTRWKNQNGQTPEEAILLSNIYTQIDLIRVLNNEISQGFLPSLSILDKDTIVVKPFARALHLNKNNKIAKSNQRIALQKYGIVSDIEKPSTLSSADESIRCRNAERINGENITALVTEATPWVYSDKINKSKLMYDHHVKKPEYSDLEQSIKYLSNTEYRLYQNSSEIKAENRTEKSLIYVPTNLQAKTTGCGITLESTQDELIKNYGEPTRVINLTSGSYHVYFLHGSVISNVDLNSIEYDENGIIFKLNNKNKVESWSLYNRMIGRTGTM